MTPSTAAPSVPFSALRSLSPPLPDDRPEALGLSTARLQRASDAFKSEVDKGTLPGATLLVGRRGRIGWFDAIGRQAPDSDIPMRPDSIFRIFSMTKPIVSLGIMMLVEDGELLLSDPVAKFIPEFADQKVGIDKAGKLELVPVAQPMTVQDLLRHTSGLAYEHTGSSPVHQLYQQSRVRSRKISNAEHASIVGGLPLICQPGAEFNYSRSTDILGRIIEVVAGQSLGAFLSARILSPLGMNETGFFTSEANAGRLAEPFAKDPWTGEAVNVFKMTEQPVMESGGGGLVATTMDYARFCAMLLNKGSLDGTRLVGRKTLELMASDHLGPDVKTVGTLLSPGHGFGLGFAVRREAGIAPFPGSPGTFFWSGIAGTFFWIDPKEELFCVFMAQAPGQRDYLRTLVRDVVYAAVE